MLSYSSASPTVPRRNQPAPVGVLLVRSCPLWNMAGGLGSQLRLMSAACSVRIRGSLPDSQGHRSLATHLLFALGAILLTLTRMSG
jgi:hypothetical protein